MRHPHPAVVSLSECSWLTGLVVTAALVSTATDTWAQAPLARSPVPGAPAGVTAFVNVNVVPMDTERVLTGQTVLVQQGWITALGPTAQVKVPTGAVRIDGRGQYFIPGLADMHVHIISSRTDTTASVFGGFASPSPARALVLDERRLFLWLANGVTTVRNMDNDVDAGGDDVVRLRARAAAGEILSPRIYTSGFLRVYSDSVLPSREKTGPLPEDFPRLAQAVEAYKAAGFDFLKMYNIFGRHVVFDSIAALARRLKLPIDGHQVVSMERTLPVHRSLEHLYIGEAGHHMNGLSALSDSALQALAGRMRQAGVWNCPTQLAAGDVGVASSPRSKARRKLIRALQDSGAGLLLGTDGLPLLHLLSKPKGALATRFETLYGDPGILHRELEALVQAGLTPYEALAMGTRNPATFFQTSAEGGTIAVGKRADLVLLKHNPLVDIRTTRQQTGVMLGGRWLPRAEIDRRVAAIQADP